MFAHLTLTRPRKLIAMNFTFLYTQFKMHVTPVSLKNYSFQNFLNRSKDILRGAIFLGVIFREE